MKVVRCLSLFTVVLGVFALSSTGNAQTSISPGKYRAYASSDAVDLSTVPNVGVTLTKAQHKYVVVLEGTVTTYVIGTVGVLARVNGVIMLPFQEVSHDCSGFCTVSATWFLDIDAAEAAHPGKFFIGTKGLPLDISLQAATVPQAAGVMTIVARKEKK